MRRWCFQRHVGRKNRRAGNFFFNFFYFRGEGPGGGGGGGGWVGCRGRPRPGRGRGGRVKVRLTGHAVVQFQGKVRGHEGGVSKGLFLFFFNFFQRKVRAGIKAASRSGCLGFGKNKVMK
jgi:hypothetical protein